MLSTNGVDGQGSDNCHYNYAGGYVTRMVAGDFNNDGKTDIAGLDAAGITKLYAGTGYSVV
nr:hypothetical protein GCM10020063_036990 [Dactylosporangium thailandense]